MPGGGSLVATNYVYSVAKPDGLTLGMPNQLVYMGQVVGDKEARFDIQKLNWIGSPDRNPTVLYIRADAAYKNIWTTSLEQRRLLNVAVREGIARA